MSRVLRVAAPAGAALILLGAWEAYVDGGGVSRFVLPAPHAIASSLWSDRSLLASNLRTTALEVLLGLALALAAGFAAAVAMHFSTALRHALYPLAVGSQAIPFLLIAPLLVFWWGFGIGPKLAIVAIVCFFPVLVTTLDALWAVDPEQLKLLRTLDATRWQAFRIAEAPAALPAALSGAKIALAVGVIAAFIAETSTGATSGSAAGLGWEVLNDVTALRPERAYAAAAVLTALSLTCFHTLALAERRLAPWAHRPRGA